MIRTHEQLRLTRPPFGSNGNSGGGGGSGGGGSTDPFRVIQKKATQPNLAAGSFFRQEAILQFSELDLEKRSQQTIWIRSFHQGLYSGYRWILPVPPNGHYSLGSKETFEHLERKIGLPSTIAYEQELFNVRPLYSKNEVLDWTRGFDFDLEDAAIEHYLDNGWSILASQVFSTLHDNTPFYRIVNLNPVKITHHYKIDEIVYPLILTGSSTDRSVNKDIEIRIYIMADYQISQISHKLPTVFKGYVNLGGSDRFVYVIEGKLRGEEMGQDLLVKLNRKKMAFDDL